MRTGYVWCHNTVRHFNFSLVAALSAWQLVQPTENPPPFLPRSQCVLQQQWNKPHRVRQQVMKVLAVTENTYVVQKQTERNRWNWVRKRDCQEPKKKRKVFESGPLEATCYLWAHSVFTLSFVSFLYWYFIDFKFNFSNITNPSVCSEAASGYKTLS